MDYLLHLGIIICIYSMLAGSLSLVSGYCGQMSLAHAGFYALGAYGAGLNSYYYDFPFFPVLLLTMFFTGGLAYIVSRVGNNTHDDYFVVFTLSVQVVVVATILNLEFTRGPLGITNIDSLSFFGMVIKEKWHYLILSLSFGLLVFFFLNRLLNSPFGRLLLAIKEDEIFTKSLGKNVRGTKVTAFVIGAVLAVIPGFLYAHYIRYIDPSSFMLDESIFILTIVILAGMRGLKNIIFATIALILIPEALRFVGLFGEGLLNPNIKQIIYGVILLAAIAFQISSKKTKFR